MNQQASKAVFYDSKNKVIKEVRTNIRYEYNNPSKAVYKKGLYRAELVDARGSVIEDQTYH
jgi:hypothetical protein